MEFEKLLKLNIEQKKKILSNLIENDVSYWEKVSILMAMLDEEAATDLLDLIVKHKREEINLANKKYNLFLNSDEINDNMQSSYIFTMDKILNGSDDIKYSNACKEVLEILNYIPVDFYNRINKNFLERLEKHANLNHNLLITKNEEFNNLNILDETKQILLLISDKFWNVNGKKIKIIEIFNK